MWAYIKLSANDVLLSDINWSITSTLPWCVAVWYQLLLDASYAYVYIHSRADYKPIQISYSEAFILFMGNIYVTGTELGLRKRWRGSDAFIVINWGFQHGCWQMHRWTVVLLVHMHSGFPAGRSKQTIVTSWVGTIKGEHTRTLGLLSGSSDTEHLGLLTSHRPSTSAILVPLVEQSITRMNCVFLFIHMHVPRPFWGIFS